MIALVSVGRWSCASTQGAVYIQRRGAVYIQARAVHTHWEPCCNLHPSWVVAPRRQRQAPRPLRDTVVHARCIILCIAHETLPGGSALPVNDLSHWRLFAANLLPCVKAYHHLWACSPTPLTTPLTPFTSLAQYVDVRQPHIERRSCPGTGGSGAHSTATASHYSLGPLRWSRWGPVALVSRPCLSWRRDARARAVLRRWLRRRPGAAEDAVRFEFKRVVCQLLVQGLPPQLPRIPGPNRLDLQHRTARAAMAAAARVCDPKRACWTTSRSCRPIQRLGFAPHPASRLPRHAHKRQRSTTGPAQPPRPSTHKAQPSHAHGPHRTLISCHRQHSNRCSRSSGGECETHSSVAGVRMAAYTLRSAARASLNPSAPQRMQSSVPCRCASRAVSR